MAEEATKEETTEETFEPTPLTDLFNQEATEKPASPEKEVVKEEPAPEKTEEAETKEVESKEKETETKEEVKEETPSAETGKEKPKKSLEEQNKDLRDGYSRVNEENTKFRQAFEQTQYENRLLQERLANLEKSAKDYGMEVPEPETPEAPPLEVLQAEADFKGRKDASKKAAIDAFGEEEVNRLILAPDAPFRTLEQNPGIRAQVLSADLPVIEAINIVKRHQFETEYGKTPEKIIENIKAKYKAELKEELVKEMQQNIKDKKDLPETLRDVKGEDVDVDKEFQPDSLDQLFDHGG